MTDLLGARQLPANRSAGEGLSPDGPQTANVHQTANGHQTAHVPGGAGRSAAAILRDLAAGRSLAPINTRRHLRSSEGMNYLRLTKISDTLIAVMTLLALFIIDNSEQIPHGWGEFLEVRLTVKNLGLLVVFTGIWQLVFRSMRLYDWSVVEKLPHEAARVYAAAAIGTLVAFLFPIMSESGAFRYQILLLFFVVATSLILLARMALRVASTTPAAAAQNIVIIGSGPRAAQMYRHLCQDGTARRHVLGFFDSDLAPSLDQEVILRLAGSLRELEHFLMDNAVDEVVIALPVKSQYAAVQDAIQICERVGVPITYPADIFSHERRAPQLEFKGRTPVIAFSTAYGPWFGTKRVIDLVGALLGLIVLSPLMVLLALVIKATSPGPVFFVQMRCGRNKRRFRMFKFRTMVEGAEVQQHELEAQNEGAGPLFKMRSDPRVTRLGAFLRRSSLDELPQLWNVLRGDMSLVGPRPLPLRDVEKFSESWLMRRFSVLPGLTGLWQVSGRSALVNTNDWIALDLAYVDRWSLWLDLEILALTVPAVLSGKGAS